MTASLAGVSSVAVLFPGLADYDRLTAAAADKNAPDTD